MRKGIVEETSFSGGGMIVISAVSPEGNKLEVKQPNHVWTSLSTSDPLAPCSFCRHSWAIAATSPATSAFGSELWQRLNCVDDLPTKSFTLY